MSTASPTYDVVIIGAGLAGLQCSLALLREDRDKALKIALIDPRDHEANDKTWCYWDDNVESSDLIHHQWQYAHIHPSQSEARSTESRVVDLSPYRYRMIRSIDFYTSALARINASNQVDRIYASVTRHTAGKLTCDDGSQLQGRYVLDSRLPDDVLTRSGSIMIHQHFLGWYIEVDQPIWKPDEMTMMDFRLQHEESTSFCYVLPVTDRKALVEYTLFTDKLLGEQQYEELLRSYISRYITTDGYKIIDREGGVIPMTTYPFVENNTSHYQRIGTAGGWVRASTGYSFYRSKLFSQKIAGAIVHGSDLPLLVGSKWAERKTRFYDRMLLLILKDQNDKGAEIFYKFYQQRTLSAALPFLDGTSSLWQDLRIILSLPKMPFLKALFTK